MNKNYLALELAQMINNELTYLDSGVNTNIEIREQSKQGLIKSIQPVLDDIIKAVEPYTEARKELDKALKYNEHLKEENKRLYETIANHEVDSMDSPSTTNKILSQILEVQKTLLYHKNNEASFYGDRKRY